MSESFDTEVAAGYESWYKSPDGQRADRLEKAALAHLLDRLPDSDDVLEVGCGTGHFTRWLAKCGWAAAGLDLSAAMLAEARALNGTCLIQGDAHRLPFSDGAFDIVMLVTTLESLERPRKALRESLRVAEKGLVLGVLNRCSLLGLRRRLRGLLRPTVYDDATFYNLSDLARLLQTFDAKEAAIDWATTLHPRWWPIEQCPKRWGGFIAMAFRKTDDRRISAD